jgi:hypothetical protein
LGEHQGRPPRGRQRAQCRAAVCREPAAQRPRSTLRTLQGIEQWNRGHDSDSTSLARSPCAPLANHLRSSAGLTSDQAAALVEIAKRAFRRPSPPPPAAPNPPGTPPAAHPTTRRPLHPTTPPHDHQIDDIDRARLVEPASDPRQPAHQQCQLPCELTCSPLWRSRCVPVVLVISPPHHRRPPQTLPPPRGRGSQCARTPARRRRR